MSEENKIEIAKIIIRVDDDLTAIQVALQDLGFIYTKEYQVNDLLKSGKLVELLPKLNRTRINIAMHYHYQQHIDNKIKAFLDFYSQTFAN